MLQEQSLVEWNRQYKHVDDLFAIAALPPDDSLCAKRSNLLDEHGNSWFIFREIMASRTWLECDVGSARFAHHLVFSSVQIRPACFRKGEILRMHVQRRVHDTPHGPCWRGETQVSA